MKKSLSAVFLMFFLTFMFISPALVLGQAESGNPTSSGGTKITNPINIDTVNGLIKRILEGVIKIGIPIIALAIIYSGFLFVTAMGNEKKLQTAKDAILYTLIGAGILLGAWAIAQLISDTVLAL